MGENLSYDLEIVNNIKETINPDNIIRKNAENYLNNLKNKDLTSFIKNLLIIFQEKNISIEIRQMTSLLINNILKEDSNWFDLGFTFQNICRGMLYKFVEEEENEIMLKMGCTILANIAFIECKREKTNMLEKFIKIINIKENTNLKIILIYFQIMKLFFEYFQEEILIPIDVIIKLTSNLILIISSENINNQLIIFSLEIYCMCLPFMKYTFTINPKYVFNPIINLLSVEKNQEILMKTLLTLNEVINIYHRDISSFTSKICEKLTEIIKKLNSHEEYKFIILTILDIFCLFSDKELEEKTSNTKYFIDNYEYFIKIFLNILETNKIIKINEEEWTIQRACCYFISFLSQIYPNSNLIEKLLVYSSSNFNKLNKFSQFNSLLIISCCLESPHKDYLIEILSHEIKNIFAKLNDDDKFISYTTSWLLGKISEIVPNIFKREKFYEIIPLLINIINNVSDKKDFFYSIETRINITIVFGNLIKYYGDEETIRYQNPFKSYYSSFFYNFLQESIKIENLINNLSFYLLRIIMNVIQYSSLDFQNSLEMILKDVLEKFEEIIQKNFNNQKEKKLYEDLEENFCLIITQIFYKIIRNVDFNLCQKVYTNIMNSFKKRKKVYATGLLCLFNVVIFIFNNNAFNDYNSNEISTNSYNDFFQLFIEIFKTKDEIENIKIILLIVTNLCWTKNKLLESNLKIIIDNIQIYLNSEPNEEVKNIIRDLIHDLEINFPNFNFSKLNIHL